MEREGQTSDLRGQISRRLKAAGANLPSNDVLAALERYLILLAKWNNTISLTSLPLLPPSDEAIDRLLVEPIAAGAFSSNPTSIIDLGSGGGSPAIPFWLQFPDASLTMVESRSRKCAFLREAVRQLGPSRAEVIHARFEDLLRLHPRLKHSAAAVTVRAVRLDAAVARLVIDILQPAGSLLRFTSSVEPAPSGLELVGSHRLLASAQSFLQIFRVPRGTNRV